MTSEETYQKLLDEYGYVYGATRREQLVAAASAYPDHPGIQALEAERRVWSGDLRGARELVDRSLVSFPTNSDLQAVNALLNGYEGDMVGAIESFENILRDDSNNRITLMNLPGSLVQVGREDDARTVLLQVEGTFPNNPRIMAGVISGYYLLQDFERALAIVERFKDDPSDLFCVSRARIALKNHDWAESEKWAREAVARNPESRSGWEHLSMLLTHKGELQEAKAAANFALELNSRSVPALRNLAKIATLEGNKSEAADYERQADSAVPFMKDHNEIRKAITLLRSGQADAAIKLLKNFMHSSNLSTRQLATSCALETISANPRAKHADLILKEVESAGVETPKFYAVKAILLMSKGLREESLTTLESGERKFPGKIELKIAQLKCYALADDRQAMESLAESLLADQVRSPVDYLGILTQLYSKDMNELADRFYQQLIRKFPSSTAVSLADSMIALNRGDVSGGLSQLNRLSEKGVIGPIRIRKGSIVKLMIKLPWLILLKKLGLRKKKAPEKDQDRES